MARILSPFGQPTTHSAVPEMGRQLLTLGLAVLVTVGLMRGVVRHVDSGLLGGVETARTTKDIGGRRSMAVAEFLESQPVKRTIYNANGGMNAWQAEGRPVVAP